MSSTIITTIPIPMTVVSGIYGMNFENMPELTLPLGYTMALISIHLIAVVMVIYFW
ncbi:MAG: CorA family divalent cation transporter, partial [Candidatus Hodarchaeota archaeon]